MKVSVIIPSTGRPEKLVECIRQLLTVSPDVEVICVIEHDQESLKQMKESGLNVKVLYHEELSGPVNCWNAGAVNSSGDAFVLGADDMWFHEGWLEEALIALETIGGSGLVGFNALKENRKDFDDCYLVTKDFCKEEFGGVFIVPWYRHFGLDVEACRHAALHGKYVYAEKAIVEHKHWSFGKSKYDDTYAIDDLYHDIDYSIMMWRSKRDWPVDYAPIF
jgi:GT2 family glycosyltransferase